VNRRTSSALGGLLFLIFGCAMVWAQATAQISGTAKDQSGAVLPGVEILVTQTDTGITRQTITNETGSYVLPNLPIGPYRLEASLPGFRTFAQTGIVLQVNSSPTVNVVLEVGQVAETVEVQANAALVETRSAGVGTVVENARILELPLNGRAVVELIALAGAATPAPVLDGTGGRDPFATVNVSVAGGLSSGLSYSLDGAYHNNPYTSGYMSLPFPDALQEFKVETGATGAQNGGKSSGSVNMVTKSGTNELHGNLFEFVRNGRFNARNAFAAERDTIKRNQFGGTLGGPISKSRLFFFAGYQGSTIREAPSDNLAFLPTPAMMAGDFSTFASPACNGGRQITLRAPFVNNRIDPARFTKPAVVFASKLPSTTDPCGRYLYTSTNRQDGKQAVGRLDYQRSASHSIFGRYLIDRVLVPAPYDVDHNVLNAEEPSKEGLAQAFTLGDTYLLGAKVVNAFRITANRIAAAKDHADYDSAGLGVADLGINTFSFEPHRPSYSITGALNTVTNSLAPDGSNSWGPTRTAALGLNEDLSLLRGNHQLALGAQFTLWQANSYSNAQGGTTYSFTGQTTGLGITDFFIGNVAQFQASTTSDQNKQQKVFAVYGTDTWKFNQNVTLSFGLRWEPYFPILNRDGGAIHFDIDEFRKGTRTTRFVNAPPGVFYEGDPGFPGPAGLYKKWWNFSPRAGVAWDVNGDGRTSVRLSGGTFYDYPSSLFMQGLINGSPTGTPRIISTDVSFADPWAGYPGGNPFPLGHGTGLPRNFQWPLFSSIDAMDYDTPNMQVAQWNLTIQKQLGTAWLASASYLGNTTTHLWSLKQTNPSVFLGLGPCTINSVQYATCSTTANRNQRRRLFLEDPKNGQLIGFVSTIDSGGKASYNGLILSLQRRAARGLTINTNYTWSRCISDPFAYSTHGGFTGQGWTKENDRHFDRGNCTTGTGTNAGGATDRRHLFNVSAVAETPQFSNRTLRIVGSGWRLSPILKIMSGGFLTVTTNQDRALTGVTSQRVDQLMLNPYGDKSVVRYLNPAAFAMSALGTIGNLGNGSILGPGNWQFDVALSRTFQVGESRRLEFRAEAFNITNSFRMNDPGTNFNSNVFGQVTSAQDPRIMQFALKYVF
jgi:Carboxypeptidase regulatory-like domain